MSYISEGDKTPAESLRLSSAMMKSYFEELKSRCAEKKFLSAFNKSTIFLVLDSYPNCVALSADSDDFDLLRALTLARLLIQQNKKILFVGQAMNTAFNLRKLLFFRAN